MSERLTPSQRKVVAALPKDGSAKSDNKLAFDAFLAIESGRFTRILNGLSQRGLIEGSIQSGWRLTAEGIALAEKL